jgi:hypothetical protein
MWFLCHRTVAKPLRQKFLISAPYVCAFQLRDLVWKINGLMIQITPNSYEDDVKAPRLSRTSSLVQSFEATRRTEITREKSAENSWNMAVK